jgi:transposase
VILDEAGRQAGSRRVAHTKEGLQELKDFLLSIAPQPDQLACIVETTHGLLITFLLEAGLPVYPVNPKTVDRRRHAAGAKTDQIDAYLLAKTGRSDLADLRRLQPDSPKVAELKTLTRDQDSLIQMQTRLVNQLTACLKSYYPVALSLFCQLQQPSTLIFLQTYPTPEQAQVASFEAIEAILRQAKHPTAAKAAARILEVLRQPQLRADEVTVRAKSRLMLSLVRQLQVVVQDITAYEKEIHTLFLTHSDYAIFESLPRAGKRLAPRLLAEWGDDRERYENAQAVQALAGTAPVAFQSGKYAKAHKRYACVKPLRYALYMYAWQTTLTESWALDYYQRKRAEGKSHSMAVRALANVWVRIIFAMWINRTLYEAATFEQAQRVHAQRAA